MKSPALLFAESCVLSSSFITSRYNDSEVKPDLSNVAKAKVGTSPLGLPLTAFAKKDSFISIFFASIFISLGAFSQDTLSSPLPDSSIQGMLAGPVTVKKINESSPFSKKPVLTPAQQKKRTWIVAGGNVIGYGGTMIALSSAWYKDYPKSKLHSFNDLPEWKQVDKVGHLYSAYIESRASMELWRWTGIDRKKRIWLGGMSGAVYQTVIEVLDGYSSQWGWSWADFGANILGSGVLVAQELAWDEQRIKLKFSFHRKNYDDPQLNQRSNVLFGTSTAERLLKDYNGQTYWASINLNSFFPKNNLPAWLSVAVGYGAEGLFGGTENIAKDNNGTVTFNRTDIKRYRQWFLAPDIDLTKIKTDKRAIKFILTVLSAFKFPTPSLEFSNGKFRLNAIHF
jgi:uncharacterized protein YfiM (DUF2279 family)